MGKLNPKKIEHEKSNGKERRLPDGDGLFLRIRPSGAKSWLFCYRLGTDRKWLQMTLGSLNDISLKEARNKIIVLRKLVADVIDPRNARAATKAENINAMSMQGLFDVWIDFTKMAKEVSPTWIKRHEDRWRIHLKPILGNILARDVTRSHLATALDAMTRNGIKEKSLSALWVFDTGRYQEGGHIHEDTLTGVISRLRGTTKGSKKRKDDNAPLSDLDHFTIHDLRRSAATAWGEHLKISPHIIEKMLNHQPLNKLEAIYQRAVYSEEQKEGWLAWGEMVQKYIAISIK